MKEIISIEAALKKAQNMITIPSMAAMFGTMILVYVLGENGIVPKSMIAPGFLLSIIFGWIVWSMQVPKWKIWAYERVNDINELKEEAIQSKIIWKDSSIFTKSEIWRKEDRAKLEQILSNNNDHN